MPAVPPYIIEPVWEQFEVLLPERKTDHPFGCHRPRIPDRVVFEKLVAVLVFGCAYWRIAEEGCSGHHPQASPRRMDRDGSDGRSGRDRARRL
jgi:hypothetical protein